MIGLASSQGKQERFRDMGRDHVRTEAGTAVRHPQAKEHLGSPAAPEAGGGAGQILPARP